MNPMTLTGPEDRTARVRPALGLAWEGRPRELLAACAPVVDVLEVVPDCLVGPSGTIEPGRLIELDELAGTTPLTYHGIGLSLGSTSGWNEDYLRLLDRLFAWREPLWHSEHLGFTHVGGSFLGTMPALPLTNEALDLVIERASAMRAHYGREFMLEHVATPLQRPAEMTLAAFLNALARESGSRLLVDLHNLECDADNGLLDLVEFVDELDWRLVGEIHVAGGTWVDGWHLDVHRGPVATSTLTLLDEILPRATNLGLVLYEVLAAAVPSLGVATVVDQLSGVRRSLEAAIGARTLVGAPA